MSSVKVLNLNPGEYRKHRFPPVADTVSDIIAGAGSELDGIDSIHDAQIELQQRLEDGFRQGVEQGHEEGLREGRQQGIQQGITEGQKEGFQKGFISGEKSGKASFIEAARPVHELYEKIASWYEQREKEQRQLICDLVQKVSQQVIRAELTLMPQQILALVDETLDSLPGKTEKVVVHLNPQDLERLRNINASIPDAWKLVPDNQLAVGGCQLITDHAEADVSCDARLNSCMDNVRKHLLDGEQMTDELPIQPESEVIGD